VKLELTADQGEAQVRSGALAERITPRSVVSPDVIFWQTHGGSYGSGVGVTLGEFDAPMDTDEQLTVYFTPD